jgi:hypothetical protein
VKESFYTCFNKEVRIESNFRTYGSETNMEQGILDGNQQHVVEINWPELAGIYEVEFNEMWGSSTLSFDKVNSNISTRKIDNTTHVIDINGKTPEARSKCL